MDNSIRFEKVYEILDKNLPENINFLNATDPFQFLISVMLSAQTTDASVNKETPKLFEKLPTPYSMASASEEEIEHLISRIGLYHVKARYLKKCSEQLVNDFDGRIPSDMKNLVSLSGVGRKTASCILGFVYNKPAVIVDTHFSNVIKKIGGKEVPSGATEIEKYVKEHLSEEKQYRFSMIINYHGRQTCKTRKPLCENCLLQKYCYYFTSRDKK